MARKLAFIGLTLCLILALRLSFAQEENASVVPEPQATAEGPEVQWLWGEVVSLDSLNKTLVVKILDYETETEKEISISTDDKTTYENIKSLDELKPQDTVSVDYAVTPDGMNLAKNITVEKPEAPGTANEEIKPQELTSPEEIKSEGPEEEVIPEGAVEEQQNN